MRVYIGSDHNGFHLRQLIIGHLDKTEHEAIDEGDSTQDRGDDYPFFAAKVVNAMLLDKGNACGVLVCGSGQGMCMAANRFKGVRAALGYDRESARSARNDDDSNILCLPALTLRNGEALDILDTWLNTPFAHAARFKRRIVELDELG